MDADEALSAHAARVRRRLLVGLQRPRAAGLEPPLGRRAAVRLGRPARRHDLGRRPEGPAAADRRASCRRCACSPTRRWARSSPRGSSTARAPRRPRPADRAAQPPRLRARRSTRHLDALGPGGELSLLVVDLDHFKRVNDTLGHDAGDDVLRRFADVLRAAPGAATGDVPTRLGGEEFALVLPGAGEARALAVAEHLRLLVRSQFATFAVPRVRLRRGRQPRRRGARRVRAHARRQPRAVRRQAPRPRPLRRPPRPDARDARRAAGRRGRGAPSSSPPRCCWPRRSTCATSHGAPLGDGRALLRADRPRAAVRARAGGAHPRRGHPPRHRQARDRRRDPAQARAARRARVGGDQAPSRDRLADPRARQPARHRRLGARTTTSASTAAATRRPARRARSRSRRASSRSPTPTRR